MTLPISDLGDHLDGLLERFGYGKAGMEDLDSFVDDYFAREDNYFSGEEELEAEEYLQEHISNEELENMGEIAPDLDLFFMEYLKGYGRELSVHYLNEEFDLHAEKPYLRVIHRSTDRQLKNRDENVIPYFTHLLARGLGAEESPDELAELVSAYTTMVEASLVLDDDQDNDEQRYGVNTPSKEFQGYIEWAKDVKYYVNESRNDPEELDPEYMTTKILAGFTMEMANLGHKQLDNMGFEGSGKGLEEDLDSFYTESWSLQAEGQNLDIVMESENYDPFFGQMLIGDIDHHDYEKMSKLKTGGLLVGLCKSMGYLAGLEDQDSLDNLGELGKQVGLIAQEINDLEDLAGERRDLDEGKTNVIRTCVMPWEIRKKLLPQHKPETHLEAVIEAREEGAFEEISKRFEGTENSKGHLEEARNIIDNLGLPEDQKEILEKILVKQELEFQGYLEQISELESGSENNGF